MNYGIKIYESFSIVNWIHAKHKQLRLGKLEIKREEGAIEIYVADLLGYLPEILLKLFYPFPYMVVGMAVGHELDLLPSQPTPFPLGRGTRAGWAKALRKPKI